MADMEQDIREFIEETAAYMMMTAFMVRDEWLDMVACIREACQDAKKHGMDAEAGQLQELYSRAFDIDVREFIEI